MTLRLTFLNQDPRFPRTALHQRLATLLRANNLRAVKLVLSYVNWQGLAAIAEPLEEFLNDGGIVQSLYGVDNGVTTPDALIYSLTLKQRFKSYRLANVVPWQFRDSVFHPKFFQFDFEDRIVLIAGSANLTGGGILRNHEIAAEIEIGRQDAAGTAAARMWRKYVEDSRPITPQLIRRLVDSSRLAREKRRAEAPPTEEGLPSVGLRVRGKTRPALYKHLLQSGTTKQRYEALAAADSLSLKPRKLYLEILRETGGGHQVQLPVASLGSFFGVGGGRSKPVTFRFPGDEVSVTLTHFRNNTHRVRLLPIRGVPRPAVVVFARGATPDEYDCEVKSGRAYASSLRHCTEQTRAGSRRWGLT